LNSFLRYDSFTVSLPPRAKQISWSSVLALNDGFILLTSSTQGASRKGKSYAAGYTVGVMARVVCANKELIIATAGLFRSQQ